MPVYEYQCKVCGTEFERIQRITAEPGGTCPKCSSQDVQRLISRTSFQLKGTGWYVTDFAGRGSGKSGDNASEASNGDSAKNSDGSTDSKESKATASKTDSGSKGSSDSSSTTKSSSAAPA